VDMDFLNFAGMSSGAGRCCVSVPGGEVGTGLSQEGAETGVLRWTNEG
jgi:hypothetical protein